MDCAIKDKLFVQNSNYAYDAESLKEKNEKPSTHRIQ